MMHKVSNFSNDKSGLAAKRVGPYVPSYIKLSFELIPPQYSRYLTFDEEEKSPCAQLDISIRLNVQ